MKNRKIRIFDYVKSKTILEPNKKKIEGVSTEDVAESLSIDRTGASRELNALIKEKQIVKIKGKPVLYLANSKINCNKLVYSSKEELFAYLLGNQKATKSETNRDNDRQIQTRKHSTVFESYIGSKGSIKYQVNQAKAAILYPPNGLHTLICGPTGVGKTTFARLMFDYGIEMGKFSKKAPFVVFNCADYAGNTQLLISLLFGYAKGAFSGATEEKRGLVDEANGGVLFLDEIHRLPPEGQEMLFSLIDRGTFRRLGEVFIKHQHQVKVLIIGATTEDLTVSILKTLIRRIPNVIAIPGLLKRATRERFNLIDTFFSSESQKINALMKVSSDVNGYLLTYDCPGNIGQLKSDIQMICANAFAEFVLNNQTEVNITLKNIPNTYSKLIDNFVSDKKTLLDNLEENFPCEAHVYKSGKKFNQEELPQKIYDQPNYRLEQHFYKNLLKKYETLFTKEASIETIKQRMKGELEEFFNIHLSEIKTHKKQALANIISPNVLKIVDEIFRNIRDFFPDYNRTVVYNVAMHIESVINKMNSHSYHIRNDIKIEDGVEYKIAEIIKKRIDSSLTIKLPFQEAIFLAMFITSVKEAKQKSNVGILVIAHGDSTASSMAQVANDILNVTHAQGLNMALDDSIEDLLNLATEKVKKINKGRGVLLLVDMGSLNGFSDTITKRTGIPTQSISMVSTPIVIEATRKSLFPNMTLDQLAEDVISASKFLGTTFEKVLDNPYVPQTNEQKLIKTLESTLNFLNPYKAFDILSEVVEHIVEKIGIPLSNDMFIKFQFHCMGMLERALQKEPLTYKRLDLVKEENSSLFFTLAQEFQIAENAFGVKIFDSELAYIVDMLSTYIDENRKKRSTPSAHI